jgi:hypothetical protein
MSEAMNTVFEYLVVVYDSRGRVVEEEFDTLEQAELFVALVGGDSVVQPYIYRLPR